MSEIKVRPLDATTLWQIERIGAVALAPDGANAVCTLTSYSMDKNQGSTALWLLPTGLSNARAAPRRLTQCGDKDGQPLWSPQGDRIAFVAKREQQGSKDLTPQLYVLPITGGEAQRKSDFAPGIESFKWLPDGSGVVFSAWVWPEERGAKAQAKRFKAFKERKETGYVTDQAFYRFFDQNLPMGRVLHLLRLDLASGRITDLFEDTSLALPHYNDGNDAYDVHRSGRRIVFVHDAAPEPMLANRLALVELDLRSRRVSTLIDNTAWDVGAPRYSPDGSRVAALVQHVGRQHTALSQMVVVTPGQAFVAPAEDFSQHVESPLRWSAAGDALVYAAEERGRRHLWRQVIGSHRADVVHAGGWVSGFDLAGDTLAVLADSARHPGRVWAGPLASAGGLRRLEYFNDKLLSAVSLGEVKEVSVTGALGDAVQMWLTFPPAFNGKKKHPINQVIHGGPFAAAGDSFAYRWNTHVLASQGHVVAQVNFHGSSGFGFAFRDSIMGQQGQLETQDIEAGTDWLLQQKWADAKNVFATGGSYGGFMVAWMNGHVPAWPAGRYRAYICHAGVFDRVATFSADSYPERPKDLHARYWDDMPRVLAQSPHAAAAHMHTPTLVIHGAEDFRVPDCNGLAYYNTLKARGVDARLLWFPDENHWVLKPQNSRLWYAEFLAWLAAHGSRNP